ncbi:hypothetical protein P9112_014104 [Eukaryota sp. TZLM1-RC]
MSIPVQKQILFFTQIPPQVFVEVSQNGKITWVQLSGVSNACNLTIVRVGNQLFFEFSPISSDQILLKTPAEHAYLSSPANLVLKDPFQQKRYWVRFQNANSDKLIFTHIQQAVALAKSAQQQQPPQPIAHNVPVHNNASQPPAQSISSHSVPQSQSFDAIHLQIKSNGDSFAELTELPSGYVYDISPTVFNHDFTIEQRLVSSMYQRKDILKNARMARSIARKEGASFNPPSEPSPPVQPPSSGNPIKDRLLEMGFPEDKVNTALSVSGGDQSKALHVLLTGSL